MHSDDSPDEDNLDLLAHAVKWLRGALGFSQVDVWDLGGPSNSTLTQIEAARAPGPSASTLRKLDKAFGLAPGTMREVLTIPPSPGGTAASMMRELVVASAAAQANQEAVFERSQGGLVSAAAAERALRRLRGLEVRPLPASETGAAGYRVVGLDRPGAEVAAPVDPEDILYFGIDALDDLAYRGERITWGNIEPLLRTLAREVLDLRRDLDSLLNLFPDEALAAAGKESLSAFGQTVAARTSAGPTPGQRQRQHLDSIGEESQDPEDHQPS